MLTDMNDLHATAGLPEVRRQIESARPVESQTETGGKAAEIDRPLLFDEKHTPEIPANLLPSWLGAAVAAIALNTQTPSAMAALMAMAVVAAVVAKRFEVALNGSGYSEPLNLWILVVLGPGNRKTAVLVALTAVLLEWERFEGERLAAEIRRINAKRYALERRREKLLKDAANADSQEKLLEILSKVESLEAEIPKELRAPRLWTGDTTPERLQSLMEEHGERMALLSDEGAIFEIMAGLYSGGVANIDAFLQGHAGRSVQVDRQGRNTRLEAPALTFGLAVQPDIVAELTRGGKQRFRGNGTLARFLYAFPRSNIGQRDVRAVYPIPPEVSQAYRDGIFDLLAIPPQIIGGREIPRRLVLTPEALECWYAFAEMIERRQGPGGDLEIIQDWSAKLPGAALRISGIFHLVEYGSQPPEKIGVVTIERALDLCSLLIEHALAAFGAMGDNAATEDAKAILNWIMEERLCRFRKGVAYRRFKGRFTGKSERFDKALNELEERAIIAPAGKEQTKGRAAMVYVVNPTLGGDRQ